MKFGLFASPIHSPYENPTLALHRDVELFQWADRLGFDEAWIGEHHSTGWEFCGSPEVFLGYVGGLTQRIRLGTGVVSLPYHHPYNVAERIVLLDHLTRGRLIFGAGPGALVPDALQLGIDPANTRECMIESLEVIIRLLQGERVTKKTDWFTLDDAKVQLPPFAQTGIETAVTAAMSPNGAALCGRLGLSMLSLIATHARMAGLLNQHWTIAEEQAANANTVIDRANWRLVGPMHIAETAKEARRQVSYGLANWVHYMTKVTNIQLVPETAKSTEDFIDELVETGYAIVGTPDDAIRQIKRLQDLSGGFGTFLLWAHDWASREDTLRSFELFARHVIPEFRNFRSSLLEAEEYQTRFHEKFQAMSNAARQKAVDAYVKPK